MTKKSEVFIWNSQVECLSGTELRALQLEQLKHLVNRLYQRVPFYKKLLDEAQFKPGNLRSLEDLHHLPFTTKGDLKAHYPFGLFSEPIENVTRLHTSSGTKYEPIVVGYSRNDLKIWAEVCARSLACAGVRPHNIVHNAYGYGLFTGGLGVHYGAELLGATVVPASGGQSLKQITLLKDFRAHVLCSTPSYALNLACTIEEMAIPLSSFNLKVGIFGAEPWSEELRQYIEEKLSIKALDIYGLSEVIGPGVSIECLQEKSLGSPQEHCGLHIWEDHFLPEIVDPKSGAPLPDGEEGELVFTTLTKEAMPLLRYRTGDLSRLIRQKCDCGRSMVKMARIKARLDDMLIIRGVNLYPSAIESILLSMEELSPHYQLVIDRQMALDTLAIQVELNRETTIKWSSLEREHSELKTLTTKIAHLVKEELGLSAEISLLAANSLERSLGKTTRVIDKRKLKTKSETNFLQSSLPSLSKDQN